MFICTLNYDLIFNGGVYCFSNRWDKFYYFLIIPFWPQQLTLNIPKVIHLLKQYFVLELSAQVKTKFYEASFLARFLFGWSVNMC